MPPISSPRALGEQQRLWPLQLPKIAQRRVYLGDCLERIAAALTCATRLKTEAGKICPDLETAGGDFLQVKAWAGGTVYAFARTLDADWRLIREAPARVTYLFFRHSVPLLASTDAAKVWGLLAATPLEVLVIPAELLKSRHKAKRHYRADGEAEAAIAISEKRLRYLARGKVELDRTLRVCGVTIHLHLLGTDLGRIMPPLTAEEQATAGAMKAELESSQLRVSLAPARRPRYGGHMVRSIEEQNPAWYRRLAASTTKKRAVARQKKAGDPDLRRGLVLASLGRLWAGICRWQYDFLLRPLVISRCRDWANNERVTHSSAGRG